MLPDLEMLDHAGLKALILAQHTQLLTHQSEIEQLKLLVAKLRRMQFGRKSEQRERQIEQLELRLEELQADPVDNPSQADPKLFSADPALASAPPPARHALPSHLPRQTQRHEPQAATCPVCGGRLRKLGEDVAEVLEYLPASFFVVRHVRPKLSCTGCDGIVQAPAPSRPIARGVAGPGLLAHVLVAKYADHAPLYRQSEIYARQGVALERSTLADWVGGASRECRKFRVREPYNEARKGRRKVWRQTGKMGLRMRCWTNFWQDGIRRRSSKAAVWSTS
jgi:transposase